MFTHRQNQSAPTRPLRANNCRRNSIRKFQFFALTEIEMNMKTALLLTAAVTQAAAFSGSAWAQKHQPGTEEFGMTKKELAQSIEKVESLIAECMHKQGFEYVPND